MIPSVSQKEVLVSFTHDLNLSLKKISDVKTWLTHVQNILANHVSLKNSKDPFVQKAQLLQQKFNQPLPEQKINVFALQTLRKEMKMVLQEKEKQLKSLLSFQEMLSEIPPTHMEAFLSVIQSNCDNGVAKGLPFEEAFARALAYALSRSFISTTDLSKCKELSRYICPIGHDVIKSTPVYFKQRVDGEMNPYEYYSKQEIKTWLTNSPTDPATRENRVLADLCEDAFAKKRIGDIVCSLIYSGMNKVEEPTSQTTLPARSIFLAACLGYPLAKERYHKVLTEVKNYNEAAREAELLQSFAIDLFEPLLRDVKEDDLRFFKWGPIDLENQTFQGPQTMVYLDDEGFLSDETFQAMEVQIQFMKAFLENQVKRRTQGDSAKLSSQMQEYIAFVKEVNGFDINTVRKKECQSKALKIILEGDTSSSSSSNKRSLDSFNNSLDSLREEYSAADSKRSGKKTKPDLSNADAQLNLLNRFFT